MENSYSLQITQSLSLHTRTLMLSLELLAFFPLLLFILFRVFLPDATDKSKNPIQTLTFVPHGDKLFINQATRLLLFCVSLIFNTLHLRSPGKGSRMRECAWKDLMGQAYRPYTSFHIEQFAQNLLMWPCLTSKEAENYILTVFPGRKDKCII